MKTVRILSVMMLMSGVFALASCGDEEDQSAVEITDLSDEEAKADTTTPTVTMPGFAFQPKEMSVKKGGAVIFRNNGSMLHTVTAGTGSDDPLVGKPFDKIIKVGKAVKIKFKKVGTQNYFCRPHEQLGMTGTITVTTP